MELIVGIYKKPRTGTIYALGKSTCNRKLIQVYEEFNFYGTAIKCMSI